MNTFVTTLTLPAMLVSAAEAFAPAPQDDAPRPPDDWLNAAVAREMERSELWYGTPGGRAGGRGPSGSPPAARLRPGAPAGLFRPAGVPGRNRRRRRVV